MQQNLGLSSSICKYEDINSKWFIRWLAELQGPDVNSEDFLKGYRKLWEWTAILEILSERGVLEEGRRGVGFAVGREPLVSLIASYGCSILASDIPEEDQVKDWASTSQYGKT
jgi:hypothetical protein